MVKTEKNVKGVFYPNITISSFFAKLGLSAPRQRKGHLTFDYAERETVDLETNAVLKLRKLEKFLSQLEHPIPHLFIHYSEVVHLESASSSFKSNLAKDFGFNGVQMRVCSGLKHGYKEDELGIEIRVSVKDREWKALAVREKREEWIQTQFSKLLAEIALRANLRGKKLECYSVFESKQVCIPFSDTH